MASLGSSIVSTVKGTVKQISETVTRRLLLSGGSKKQRADSSPKLMLRIVGKGAAAASTMPAARSRAEWEAASEAFCAQLLLQLVGVSTVRASGGPMRAMQHAARLGAAPQSTYKAVPARITSLAGAGTARDLILILVDS